MTVETALVFVDAAVAQDELQFLEDNMGTTYAMNNADMNEFLDG